MTVEVTVGIDIGTTSVKALAVDGDGRVVHGSRVAHQVVAGDPGELAHPAREVWHDAVLEALRRVTQAGDDLLVRAVNVAAMVPSLAAVDGDGVPISDGLLYGDARGVGGDATADPTSSGELVRFLRWLVRNYPDAGGYWPAQAVANAALCGSGAIDTTVAFTTLPLFDFHDWDREVAASAGLADVSRLPRIVSGTEAIGAIDELGGALVGGGTIDALGEQLVAGAIEDGDVLVILGSTLIVWAVVPSWRTAVGVWTVPHTHPGKTLIGGPSNAGGLFLDWVDRLIVPVSGTGPSAQQPLGTPPPGRPAPRGETGGCRKLADPWRVPVWQPYVRGERVPLHDPSRRASLHDLDVGLDNMAVRRGAHEASAFAVRHILDRAGVEGRRIVATGGGVYDVEWVQALADGTGLPVDVVAVPQGGALGAAWLARQTAGLEPAGADARAWVRIDHRVEPDARWLTPTASRYQRYRELSG